MPPRFVMVQMIVKIVQMKLNVVLDQICFNVNLLRNVLMKQIFAMISKIVMMEVMNIFHNVPKYNNVNINW